MGPRFSVRPLSVLERVRITEGFLKRKCMRILLGHWKLSVIETVRIFNRELSEPRGSTVAYITAGDCSCI